MLSRHGVYILVLALGAGNALIRPVMIADQSVSFVIWLALLVAFCLMVQGARHCRDGGDTSLLDRRDLVLALLTSMGFLVPFASVSWLSLAAFSGAVLLWGRGLHPFTRAGLALMMVLSLRQPVTESLLNLFGEPLLGLDALLVSGMLQGGGIDTNRLGNLVIGPDGHQLLILTGCASYANMSLALVGWYALANLRFWQSGGNIRLIGVVELCLSIWIINIIRLSVMGLGFDWYVYFHDGPGVWIFDATLMTATFWLGWKRGTDATIPDFRRWHDFGIGDRRHEPENGAYHNAHRTSI